MKRLVLHDLRAVRWFGSNVDCIVNRPTYSINIMYIYNRVLVVFGVFKLVYIDSPWCVSCKAQMYILFHLKIKSFLYLKMSYHIMPKKRWFLVLLRC
jgi:hypothetical protein